VDLQLVGQRALVTGASSGLGRSCAAALANEGASVFICARTPDRLAKAASEIGAKGFVVADLASGEDIDRTIDATIEALGGLDILVTNVPDPKAGSFSEMSDDDWFRSHEATLMTVVRLVRAAVPHLIHSRRAAILNITSSAARELRSGRLFSAAYRSGVVAVAKHLSVELAPHGVTVNNIAPGDILTPAWDHPSAVRNADLIPLKRLGDPAEVGALCAFLCSNSARYITGQTIVIDGGLSRLIS